LGTVAGRNGDALDVALHEFGHSFADLADEYDYADGATHGGGEPVDANVSIFDAAMQVAQGLKWHLWMDLPHVDSFEGAAYSQFGIYRPTVNSKMRGLNRPFEEINVEQFVIKFYETVSPIDDATTPEDGCTTFFVTPTQPVDHSLAIQWSIDGAEVAGAVDESFAIGGMVSPGTHVVTVEVWDDTPRVRDADAKAKFMRASREWSTTVDDNDECVCACNGSGAARCAPFADCNANGYPDDDNTTRRSKSMRRNPDPDDESDHRP